MNKEIRFIDSSYRELFKIPDNGIVKITLSDGEIMERQCKYIDDYHFELLRPDKDYGETFHICQFAEIMERNGHKYEPIFGRSYVLETPSADEQGLVYRSSDNDVIRKAAKNSRSASEFFGDIESMGYEYFIDAGTPGFRDSVKSLVEREADFEGLTKKTMDGLKKEAGIKPHEMER